MAYPTSLDSFTTKIDGVDYPKASHINSLQTAVEALETKVGVENSAISTSIDYIIKNNIWPIGSVFTAVVSTNPNILLGFGTWSQIAQGQMLIGQKSTDTDFNVAEETGGAKTVTIAETNLPAHVHTVNPPSTTSSGQSVTHTHSCGANTGSGSTGTGAIETGSSYNTGNASVDHTHTVDIAQFNSGSVGSGTALSVMNPYFVVYAWKRTA